MSPRSSLWGLICVPCPLVDKATISKLVPFTETDTFDSKNGLAVDNAYSTCHWASKSQSGAANQVIRDLKARVVLRAADERHDALTNPALPVTAKFQQRWTQLWSKDRQKQTTQQREVRDIKFSATGVISSSQTRIDALMIGNGTFKSWTREYLPPT